MKSIMNDSFDFVYEQYKKYSLWTLTEGMLLLTDPEALTKDIDGNSYRYFDTVELMEMDLKLFTRAIRSGYLRTVKPDIKTTIRYEPDIPPAKDHADHKKFSWHNRLGSLNVDPFEFLGFVKEKNICSIPPELEYNIMTEQGEPKYQWLSKCSDEINSKNKSNTDVIKQEKITQEMLIDFCPELEKFYNNLNDDLTESIHSISINKADPGILHKHSLDYLKQNKIKYLKIEKDLIDDPIIYKRVERRKRKIIGIILQNYLRKNGICKPPPIGPLLKRHNKIIRET